MEKPLQQRSSLHQEVSSHPLFSIITTFFLLNLLYFPNLLPFMFSPVLITTSLILATLIRFRSPQPESTPPKDHIDPTAVQPAKSQPDAPLVEFEQKTNMTFCGSPVEWGRKGGPLEVIYEEYEGEENDSDSPEHSTMTMSGTRRLDFIRYYRRSTDSDTDSDELLKDSSFWWGDDDEEGMIEIALEEDSLIEIDLSACG